MRRDFSRIRRQIGKLRESQMSLIGAETCRMNAACALGLCVAGGSAVALCRLGMLRRLGPSPSRGSSWLGGLFWRRVSRSQILSEDPLYGVINGHVCKRRDEHPAACRGYLTRRRGDYRRLAGTGRTLNCREAVRREGHRPLNPSVCHRSRPSASSWRSWEPGGICT